MRHLMVLLMVISLRGYSQNATTFKVRPVSIKVDIYPSDDYLFFGYPNKIRITSSEGKISVKVEGATAQKKDSVYYLTAGRNTSALLSVFIDDGSGKKVLALTKKYRVVPYPEVSFMGVGNDSVIDKLNLMAGFMKASYKMLAMRAQVVAFEMPFFKKDQVVIEQVVGNRLNQGMRNYIDSLPAGGIVYFENIKLVTPQDSVITIPALRLFIEEPKRPRAWGL